MSDGMNKVILLGNLGSEPELRYTGNGTAVLHFRLATNESWLDKNKESQERTEWHSVVVWGARAEALGKILAKGSHVVVEGGLRTSSFEKDGVKKYRTEIHAREVFLTSSRRSVPPPDEELGRAATTNAGRNGKAQPPPALELEAGDDMPY